jgi:hypothetical protein
MERAMNTTDEQVQAEYFALTEEIGEAQRRFGRLSEKLEAETDPVRAAHLREALAQQQALLDGLVMDKAQAGPEVRAARAAGKAPDAEPEDALGLFRRLVRERAPLAGPRHRSLLDAPAIHMTRGTA